jgi:haloacetate dehalogenase
VPASFSHHTINANGIKQHFMEAGAGPPVILLHGFPETGYAWRKQIPALAERYRVIVPDMRGYGEAEKPPAGYGKRNMVADISALMWELGIGRAPLIGHDRGARVSTRFAKDHPGAISHLGVLDNIPTPVIFERMNAEVARSIGSSSSTRRNS